MLSLTLVAEQESIEELNMPDKGSLYQFTPLFMIGMNFKLICIYYYSHSISEAL